MRRTRRRLAVVAPKPAPAIKRQRIRLCFRGRLLAADRSRRMAQASTSSTAWQMAAVVVGKVGELR